MLPFGLLEHDDADQNVLYFEFEEGSAGDRGCGN